MSAETSYINSALMNKIDPLRVQDSIVAMIEDKKTSMDQCLRISQAVNQHTYPGRADRIHIEHPKIIKMVDIGTSNPYEDDSSRS